MNGISFPGSCTQLDIMPRQVLNEVLIAEVRLTDDLKYGIEFLIGGVPRAGPNLHRHPHELPTCPAGFWWPGVNNQRLRRLPVLLVLLVLSPPPPPPSPG